MKRIYALLFNLTLISSHSIAKPSKIDTKYEADNSSENLKSIRGKVDYTIKSGDTLLAIARKHYTTRAEIRAANSMRKGEILRLGRVIKVPTNTFFPKGAIAKHSIQKGDTLLTIAKKYSSTTDEICALNSITKKTNLKLGRVLKIPTNTYKSKKESKKKKVEKRVEKPIEKKVATTKEKVVKVALKEDNSSKIPLTIASVVKEEREKSVQEEKLKELKAKEEALKLALKKREAEEQAILDRAEAIKRERAKRAEAERKAKLAIEAVAKAKAEAEKKRLEAIAKEKARIAKIKAQKEAREKARLAKIKADTIEKERLHQIVIAQKAKLVKLKKESDELNKELQLKADLLKQTKENILKAQKKMDSIEIDIKPKSTTQKEIIKSKKKIVKDTIVTPTTIITKNNKIIDYKVKKGDNFYKIAKAHHTTTIEVRDTNKFRSNSDLVVGDIIKVPVDTYFHLKDYTIESGDTLYKIARKHNTTTTRVLLANSDMSRKSKLRKGRVIKVPVDTFSLESDIHIAEATPTTIHKKLDNKREKTTDYKIKKGDTLYKIAKKSGATIKKLKEINKIKSNKELKIGDTIALPITKKSKKLKLATKNKDIKIRKRKEKKIAINSSKNRSFDSFMKSLSGSGQKALPKLAKKHLGKRYVWGATGPYKFDCSGFTSYVCKKNGVCIPRTSINQSKVGKYVSRNNLIAGDLIFFDTSKRRKGYVNHVGIYIGNNKFIHASSAKKKVVVTSLNKPFYKSRFKWGRRVDM
jgi:cell wall-associated NlpC family hydrolase